MLLGANVVFPWFWNHLFFQVRLNLGYLLLYLHTIKNVKYHTPPYRFSFQHQFGELIWLGLIIQADSTFNYYCSTTYTPLALE